MKIQSLLLVLISGSNYECSTRPNDIGSNPEKVISGDFAGQGANGARGPVHFRIKGNDVVVTKPNGEFVTILKNGITNTSVKTALKGVK